MPDSLFARAQLAIEEGERLRAQRRILTDAFDAQTTEMRLVMYESASTRMERQARREDKI